MPALRKERHPIRTRLVAIREATGLRQVDFVESLNRAARALYGALAGTYTQSGLSKLENGPITVTLEDVAVFAAVDPERRGKLWLAWNETEDSALTRRPPAQQRKGPRQS